MRTRLVVLALVIVGTVVVSRSVAAAKILPVTELRVLTQRPTAGQAVRVVLHVDPASDVNGAPALTHGELAVVPARSVDADGWPQADAPARFVVLKYKGDGEYRGSFRAKRPGSYVVFSQSSAIAHAMAAQNVGNIPTNLPAPITVRVAK